ncbi:MAG: hypothetical protein KUG62_04485 [Rhodobacteraceae bacterium]|nr:hypothetical protein [Paracoccaceae bacterium]
MGKDLGKLFLAVLITGFLTACDADSVPTQPNQETKSTGTGVTVTGSARVGVVYGPKGTPDRY